MVVCHVVLVAIVVEGDGGFPVVGWVDVYFVVEGVGRGVRSVEVCYERAGHFGWVVWVGDGGSSRRGIVQAV